jgi:hypothetical protein
VSLVEDCEGVIRGTLFDASDMAVCPAFSAVTGYAVGLYPEVAGIASRTFGLTDNSVLGTHPWSPISNVTTDANGNFSLRVFAPANYQFDFSALSENYFVDPGPKLTCISSLATIITNPIACITQPCTVLNGMNFGFLRIYGGWWQVIGGSVHGEKGITSTIPSSLLTEMSLILPDASPANKRGFLSYDTTIPYMIGSNPNAKVSASLLAAQSKYTGSPVYDWSFFDKRYNLFARTEWNGLDALSYDDLGVGYQIFRSKVPVANFDFSPTGTQKAIFLIDGDVRITSDIVVPEGAFLAVISSGTITFDSSISNADGWFVGNVISVPCMDAGGDGCDKTDTQFLGNGSFVSWGSMSLGRDRAIVNNSAPSELFTYRRDLFLNAPAPMKIYAKVYKPFVP